MNKIVIIILVVATLLNIITGAFLYLDIRTMDLPVTTLTVDLADLTADEALLNMTLQINNPNGFSLFVENLTVTTFTDNGDTINQFTIPGGEIPGHQNETFATTTAVRFHDLIPNTLTSKITGTIGALFYGLIKKTLPLTFTMVTSLHNIITQFTLPEIHLEGNFSNLTQDGVTFTASAAITNPYTIDLALENLSMNIITDTGLTVGTITMPGRTIPAKTTQRLNGSGQLLLKALDAKTLQMNLQGTVIVLVAGIRKSMDLSIDAAIVPPQIKTLLSDLPTDASLSGHYTLTISGLRDHIAFKVVNPNKLTFRATDLTVHIYRVDRNKTRLISNGTIADGVIAQQATTLLQGDMIIPYLQLLPRLGERLFADQLQIILRGNFTIQGLNQTIWVGMIGYQDFPFHRL
jgi:LEA14-like dessication related protein